MKSFASACLVSLLLIGCGGAVPRSSTADLPIGVQFVGAPNHTWFPIEPGVSWVLVGEHDGELLEEYVRVLPELRELLGIACSGVEEDVRVAGLVTQRTIEWFVQDSDGNVWKFGEEAFVADARTGALSREPDSWIAGQDGQLPWISMPARPAVGAEWGGTGGNHVDAMRVLSTDETVVVPAGTFHGCLQIVENPDDPEDSDIILYAPGVGRVLETNPEGHVQLVDLAR